jgi:SAM-dependent methyltransferase
MSHTDSYQATSERVTEDEYQAREGDYLIYLFHLATYDFARPHVEGRRVLDFGCGTGYGTHRIASGCAAITGIDVSTDAVAFARARYRAENLDFRVTAPVEEAPLPFADGSFDAVLSFQVIEHVPDPDRYVSEANRVLASDGVMLVATPDRRTRLLPGQRPWNRYHRTEFAPDQLRDMLGRHFGTVEAYGMGADPAIIGRELKRSRRLKVATLPFTFPHAPEPWRQAGLTGLKLAQARLRGRAAARGESRAEGAAGGAGEVPTAPRTYPYDEKAIRIEPGVMPSVNIVAVARKA